MVGFIGQLATEHFQV